MTDQEKATHARRSYQKTTSTWKEGDKNCQELATPPAWPYWSAGPSLIWFHFKPVLALKPGCFLKGFVLFSLCRFCEALSQLCRWGHRELLVCTMFAQFWEIQSFPLFSVLAGAIWLGGIMGWDGMGTGMGMGKVIR